MSKRIIIFFVLLIFLGSVSAQKKLNFIEVDKHSYELFQQKKWAELIGYSAESRNQGIDFFYLQARTGIAYYNLKKYRNAANWFLKAWENDQSFEWLQEYLYYSLVYGGRVTEASKLAVNFTQELQQKLNYSKSKLTRIALEGGYSFNPDFDQLINQDLGDGANLGDDYGEAYILKNYHFESVDLSHQVLPGFYLNHNFTYLGVNREEQVDWGSRNTAPIKTNQFQYFINPHFLLGKKLYVSPSFNVTWGNSSYFVGWQNSNSNRFFTEVEYSFSDIIFSTSAWLNIGNISPGAEVNLADINENKFMQLSAWLTMYPFSNTNFYLTPRVYFKGDKNENLGYNTFGISGGAQLGKVHFLGEYLTGEMENFIESAGYVIGNFPGKSDQKISGSLFVPVGKQTQFVFRYINQDVTEKYNIYTSGTYSSSSEYKYVKHTLTLGLSWRF